MAELERTDCSRNLKLDTTTKTAASDHARPPDCEVYAHTLKSIAQTTAVRNHQRGADGADVIAEQQSVATESPAAKAYETLFHHCFA